MAEFTISSIENDTDANKDDDNETRSNETDEKRKVFAVSENGKSKTESHSDIHHSEVTEKERQDYLDEKDIPLELYITAQVAHTGSTVSKSSSFYRPNCLQHPYEHIRGYCNTCDKSVCWKCVTNVCSPGGHGIQSIEDAVEQRTREVQSFCDDIESITLKQAESKLQELDAKMEETEVKKAKICNAIEDSGTYYENQE